MRISADEDCFALFIGAYPNYPRYQKFRNPRCGYGALAAFLAAGGAAAGGDSEATRIKTRTSGERAASRLPASFCLSFA